MENDLSANNHHLSKTIANNKVLEETSNNLNIIKNSLESDITELRKLNLILSNDNSTLQANFESTRSRLQDINSEFSLLKEKNSNLEDNLSSINSQLSETIANYKVSEETLNSLRLNNSDMELEIKELRKSTSHLLDEKATILANFKTAEGKLYTQKAEIEEIRKTSHLEFERIANELLENKSKKFATVNKENIENILIPLKTDIESFKIKVEETYNKESNERFSLQKEVKNLIEQTNKVKDEANNLATALKGQTKKQGDWGEMILNNILEINELVRGRDYDVQYSIKNSEGEQQFLDVVVNLPDNRKLIIDSKVTLNAYERYCSAETEDERAKHLKDHIQALTNHIDQLSNKKYEEMETSPDFVMLFVSIESAYLTAIQNDSKLWSRAYSKKIMLISPNNLMSAMKIVSDLWKRDTQSKNALEIAKQGEKLYEKFIGFLTNMESIGNHINRTKTSYDNAFKQLSTGNGNLISQAVKLKELGVKTSKSLPINMRDYDNQPIQNENSDTQYNKLEITTSLSN